MGEIPRNKVNMMGLLKKFQQFQKTAKKYGDRLPTTAELLGMKDLAPKRRKKKKRK